MESKTSKNFCDLCFPGESGHSGCEAIDQKEEENQVFEGLELA